MSEKLLAHSDLAAWFAHAFDSAAMDLGTTGRGGEDMMSADEPLPSVYTVLFPLAMAAHECGREYEIIADDTFDEYARVVPTLEYHGPTRPKRRFECLSFKGIRFYPERTKYDGTLEGWEHGEQS